MKSKSVDKYTHTVISQPYDYFRQLFTNVSTESEDIVIDAYNITFNPENTARYIEWCIKNVIESRKAPWLIEAMKHDPAFMVDPINDYYLKLIPGVLRNSLNDRELLEAIALYDPVTWGQLYLLQKHVDPFTGKVGWQPRMSKDGISYQAMPIRCRSPRLVVRAGRRVGKTAALVVKILHRAFTWTPTETLGYYNIVIFTPNQSQLNTIFKMIEIMIDNNPVLLNEIKNDGRIPTRKTPNIELEFKNGVVIKGFVSGSTAIRSSSAHFLVIDEASYLTTPDIEAAIALITENPEVELWVSSTPSGLRDWFYQIVHSEDFVSFHFPSNKFHPYWNEKMESDMRALYTDAGYKHEILAEFAADGQGVFQTVFIDKAKRQYKYEDQRPNPECYYGFGVDWNDMANGTKICIVEYNPSLKKYRVVGKESVSIENWTQLMAVKKIQELNRIWQPAVIYCDYGHGATAIELLHALGAEAPPNSVDRKLLDAKSINFSSYVDIYDPGTNAKVQKPLKPYMVNNAVRIFEEELIEISEYDNHLIKQMENYIIDHYTPKGIPVYKASPEFGDHDLDALMLALLGFNLEFSSLTKPRFVASFVVSIPQKYQAFQNRLGLSAEQLSYIKRLEKDKEFERQEYLLAHGIKDRPLTAFGRSNVRRFGIRRY